MLPDWKAASLLGSLDRLVGREPEVRLALERAEQERLPERSAGLLLASRFPELEALGPLIKRSPAEVRVLAESADEAEAPLEKGEGLARLVKESPYLSRALHAAYPDTFPMPRVPVIGVLLADPLLNESGEPCRPLDQPRWRIPWRELERRLRKSLNGAKVQAEVVLRPATWEDASWLAARASVLFIVCHGTESGELVWERRESGEAHVVPPSRLRELFGEGTKPSLAVLLACHAEPAAAAIHDAGVPVTAATKREKPLLWEDALVLIDSIVISLVAGRGPVPALKGARAGTHDAADFRIFGSDDGPWSAPPSGVATLESREGWISEEPSEAFVGRERELARVWQELQRPARLVWITGAPGMGKTELARAVLDRAALYRWPSDGTSVVRLRGARTERDIVSALSLVQGAGKQDPTLEAAARSLALSSRLILLDNAEDVPVPELRRLTSALVETGKAHVLVTSRDPLVTRFPSTTVRLEPDHSLAASLLRAHVAARSSLSRWVQISADSALTDLIEQMDGHSLSLAIAAARIALGETPASVLQSFRRLATLHVPGSPADDETHVATALSGSLDALRSAYPSAVEMWRLIADSPSGLPEPAELGAEDAEDLAILVKRCLVEHRFGRSNCLNPIATWARKTLPEPSPERWERFRLAALGGLVRIIQDLNKDLGTGDARSSLAAFASWIALIDDLVEAPPGGQPRADLAKMVAIAAQFADYSGHLELANRWMTRTARWDAKLVGGRLSLAQARIALQTGDPRGAWNWLNRLDASALSRSERAEAANLRGELLRFEEKLEEARDAYRQALDLYRALESRIDEANTLHLLAVTAVRQCQYAEARRLLDEALVLFRAAGHKLGEANALACLGTAAFQDSRPKEARNAYEAALSAYRAVDSRRGEALALYDLSRVALWEGNPTDAGLRLEESLALLRAIGDRRGEASTLDALSELALRRDKLDEARSLREQALSLSRAVGDKLGEANSLRGLGELALHQGHLEGAERTLQEALTLFHAMNESIGEGRTLCLLGDFHLAQGRLEEARRYFESAIAASARAGDRLGRANAQKSLGDVAANELRVGEARSLYEEALRFCQETGEKLGEANALLSLGSLDIQEIRHADAERSLRKAAELCRAIGYQSGLARALLSLGEVSRRERRPMDARRSLEEALRIFREIGERTGEAQALMSLGALAIDENQPGQARDAVQAALDLFRTEGDVLQQANALRALGTLALREERLDDAKTAYELALELFRSASSAIGQASTLGPLGDVARAEHRLEEARATYKEALAIFKDLNDKRGVVNAQTALAEVIDESESEEVHRLAIDAAGLAQAINYPQGAVRAFLAAAGTHPPNELALLHAARSIARAGGLLGPEVDVLHRLAVAVRNNGDESRAAAIQAAGLVKAHRIGAKLDAELATRLQTLRDVGLADKLVEDVDRFLDDVEAQLVVSADRAIPTKKIEGGTHG